VERYDIWKNQLFGNFEEPMGGKATTWDILLQLHFNALDQI
jgi:hypothetical protein